jgi:hypothetical protein
MSFKQFFTESNDSYKVLRRFTKKELKDLTRDLDTEKGDIEQAWIVYMNDDYDEGQVIVAYIPDWKTYSIYTLDPNTIDLISHEDINSPLAKAIKKWEFKNNLSDDTKDSFGGLLDVI